MDSSLRAHELTRISISDVERATHPRATVKCHVALQKLVRTPLESCCDYSSDVIAVDHHPLIAAAHIAFDEHRPLTLSPDMLWLAIVQGVALHVNLNAEHLRKEFVQHEGKEKISIRRDDFRMGSPENPWPEVFSAFSGEIQKRVGAKHALFVERFSTTGAVEKAAFEVAFLDAMQSYFNFELETLCGIPEVLLEGRTEDWEKIRGKLADLEPLGLGFWTARLRPILEQFIRASKGDVERPFWQNLYKIEDNSGGPYITGWITHFLPYAKEREHETDRVTYFENPFINESKDSFSGLSTNHFSSGLSMAPFVWDYLGRKYDYEFIGGFVGVTQDKQTLAVRPKIGWAVRPVQQPKVLKTYRETLKGR